MRRSGYGYGVYHRKCNTRRKPAKWIQRIFLAEGSRTGGAIGASLIASQYFRRAFHGMSGSGFALGLAFQLRMDGRPATLIIVAIFFIPSNEE